MDKFWKNWFTDSQPELRTVLDLQPGHIQARNTLNIAVRDAGTDTDESPSIADEGGMPWWGWLLIGLGVLALVAAIVYFLRQSGRIGGTKAPAAARAAPAVVVPQQPVPERGRTVVATRPEPAAISDDQPTLVISNGASAGKSYPITKETFIGREDSDIVVPDEEVSRRHAMIRPVNGNLELSDLRSSTEPE